MKQPLWQAEDIIRLVRGQCLHEQAFPAYGISIDSRTLLPGELFIALKGPQCDGHNFVADAFAAGACAALVEHPCPFVPPDAPLIVVEDSCAALQNLARAARARSQALCLGVTGSVGKTTCKEMLRLLLTDADPRAVASQGGLNNHIGVPLSLARLPADAPWGLFEMGMNQAGELSALSQQVLPSIALITGVEAAHLAAFGSIEAIARAKAEIFDGLLPQGTALLNRDNDSFALLHAAAKKRGIKHIYSFGTDKKADGRLLKVIPTPDGLIVDAVVRDITVTFRLGASGKHLALLAVGALLAAQCAGVDIALHAEALAAFHAPQGRGAKRALYVDNGSAVTLIDETYNANPASVRAAIAVLAHTPKGFGGKRIMVLGDMLELGPDAPLLHAGLAADLAVAGIDSVFCCGPLMAGLYDALPPSMRGGYAPDSAALATLVVEAVEGGDAVSVKGSHSMKMYNVIKAFEDLAVPQARVVQGLASGRATRAA